MYWRSLTTATQSHHVTPHVNYLQSFPWIHADSQAPGSPKLHLWFRQLTPWIPAAWGNGPAAFCQDYATFAPWFFLTESLSTGVHHRSETSVVSCLAQWQITQLWHLLCQTWVTLIYQNKHIKASSQSQTFSTKGLKPGCEARKLLGRFFGPPGMPPCDIGSPCLVQWGISKCSGFWKTVVDHVASCYYFAESLWDLFLKGLTGFGGCSKAVPLRRGSWSWRSRSTTRPPGLCWMVHGLWPMWFSGFWSSPTRSSEKQTFATAWLGQLLCTWFSKSFLILRWLITHPPPPSDVQSASLMRSIGTELGPVGPSGAMEFRASRVEKRGPETSSQRSLLRWRSPKQIGHRGETNIADLNAAWGAPGNGCFLLHFSNLLGFQIFGLHSNFIFIFPPKGKHGKAKKRKKHPPKSQGVNWPCLAKTRQRMSLARCLIVIYDTAPGWPAQMAIRSFKKGWS